MKFDNRKQAVKDMMLLYGVTDRTWSSNYPLIQRITEALDNGMTCVQLREKHMSDEDFLSEAREVSALCKHYNVPFIINDNVDVAIACGADGIHVGQSDEAATQVRARVDSSMIVGVSASSLEEAIKKMVRIMWEWVLFSAHPPKQMPTTSVWMSYVQFARL